MRIETLHPNTSRVTGYAMTQYGDWKLFTADIHRRDTLNITRGLESLANGEAAIIELGNVAAGAIYVTRLPPGIGLIDGRPGRPDLLLYCSQVVDSIAEAMRMLG